MIKQLAKILLVSSFIISGFSKLADFYQFTETLRDMGLSNSNLLGAMIILAQLGGSILIVLSNNDQSMKLAKDGKIIKKETINIKKKYGKLGIIALIAYIIFNAYYFDLRDNVKLIQGVSLLGALIILYIDYIK